MPLLLEAGEGGYNVQLTLLSDELARKLTNLKQEAEHRIRMERQKQEAQGRKQEQGQKREQAVDFTDLPDALLFINAATEDTDLMEAIREFMDENDLAYALPLGLSDNPSAADVRKDLENNLKTCDLFIVLHGRSSVPWVREQLLHGRRMGRFRKENPLRLMVIHDQTDINGKVSAPLNVSMKNLKVYKCPPGDIADYLPECIREACPEDDMEAADA